MRMWYAHYEDVVCALDISNLILIASLAMDMMNRLKNRGNKVNIISNRQDLELYNVQPNGAKVFSRSRT